MLPDMREAAPPPGPPKSASLYKRTQTVSLRTTSHPRLSRLFLSSVLQAGFVSSFGPDPAPRSTCAPPLPCPRSVDTARRAHREAPSARAPGASPRLRVRVPRQLSRGSRAFPPPVPRQTFLPCFSKSDTFGGRTSALRSLRR